MVDIKTYIKKNEIITSLEGINEEYFRYFVCCDDESWLQYVTDFDYIEGAITIFCDGVNILDFRYWDLVDQLWSYLIEGLNEILNGNKNVKFYFPDQPIEFKMQEISGELLLLTIKEKKFVVNRQEFVVAALKEAKKFYKILGKCSNEYVVEQSKDELRKIGEIVNDLQHF